MWVSDNHLLVGLDIGGSKIAGVVFNGTHITQQEWREVPADLDTEQLGQAIVQVLELLIASRRNEFRAVGIGVPGVLDETRTRIVAAPHRPTLTDLDLPGFVRERFGLSAVMDNDVRAAALGELKYGQAGDSFVFVSIGTGIGGAVVERGEVLRGHGTELSAGEIGHMRLREGKTFEQLASQQFLATTPLCDIKTLLAALSAGDPGAQEVASALARGIGEGLGNLINVLDPATIVLAGGLANAWPKLEPEARSVIRTVVLSPEAQETPIRMATFGDYAGAVGAAALTIE